MTSGTAPLSVPRPLAGRLRKMSATPIPVGTHLAPPPKRARAAPPGSVTLPPVTRRLFYFGGPCAI